MKITSFRTRGKYFVTIFIFGLIVFLPLIIIYSYICSTNTVLVIGNHSLNTWSFQRAIFPFAIIVFVILLSMTFLIAFEIKNGKFYSLILCILTFVLGPIFSTGYYYLLYTQGPQTNLILETKFDKNIFVTYDYAACLCEESTDSNFLNIIIHIGWYTRDFVVENFDEGVKITYSWNVLHHTKSESVYLLYSEGHYSVVDSF